MLYRRLLSSFVYEYIMLITKKTFLKITLRRTLLAEKFSQKAPAKVDLRSILYQNPEFGFFFFFDKRNCWKGRPMRQQYTYTSIVNFKKIDKKFDEKAKAIL